MRPFKKPDRYVHISIPNMTGLKTLRLSAKISAFSAVKILTLSLLRKMTLRTAEKIAEINYKAT